MAFLEAQAWRSALDLSESAAGRPAAGPSRQRSRVWTSRVPFITGSAAAVLMAFLTGFLSRELAGGSARPDRDGGRSQFAIERGAAGSSQPAGPRTPPASEESALHIPVLVADPKAAGEMLRQPSALPEYVRLQLQRRGYEVEGDRKLMSVALKDGRNVTLPVETFKYRYVGYRVH